MSKKSRKARAKSHTTAKHQRRDTAKFAKPPEPAVTKPETKSTVTPSDTTSIAVSQKNRYQYIGPELRRIAIIAAGLIVILIILTFVLG
jgi:hypothetical protein